MIHTDSDNQLSFTAQGATALLTEDEALATYNSPAAREHRLTELRVAILKGPLNYQVLCEELECPLRVLIQDVNVVVKELSGILDKVDVGSYRAMLLLQKQSLRAQVKDDLASIEEPSKRTQLYNLLNRMLDDELAFIEKSAPPPTRSGRSDQALELTTVQGASVNSLVGVLRIIAEKLTDIQNKQKEEPITVDAVSTS